MRRSPIALPLPVAAALVLALPALASHRQNPPPVVLVSEAGRQRGAQESFCVRAPPHGGELVGVTRCADTPDLLPRRVSIVRPRELVTITFRGAAAIADGSALVRVLGQRRPIYRFALRRPTTRWRVRLRRRPYEIEVFARFQTGDGRTGDTSASLGLLVSRTRPLAVVPLAAARPRPPLTG